MLTHLPFSFQINFKNVPYKKIQIWLIVFSTRNLKTVHVYKDRLFTLQNLTEGLNPLMINVPNHIETIYIANQLTGFYMGNIGR